MTDTKVQEYYTPADKWLKTIEKIFPNIWAILKKSRETMVYDVQKSEKWAFLKLIPDWVEMPSLYVQYLLKSDKYKPLLYNAIASVSIREDMMYGITQQDLTTAYLNTSYLIFSLAPFYLWRKGKRVYRFSDVLYNELINQPLDASLQAESFFHLPDYAVYIETPGLKFHNMDLEGFVANLDYQIDENEPHKECPCLAFSMFFKGSDIPIMQKLLLHNSSLKECVDELYDMLDGIPSNSNVGPVMKNIVANIKDVPSKESTAKTLGAMLNLLMYLCSEEPDVVQREQPLSHGHKKEKGSIPKEPRIWDVGARISHVIMKYKKQDEESDSDGSSGTGLAKRPHIRRAHWHSYWVGPRDEVYPNRKVIVKWLPPIPINVRWQDELPVDIKIVDNPKTSAS